MRSTKWSRPSELVEAQRELSRRSIPGALSYFGLLFVVGLFTPYAVDHPRVFNAAVGVLLLIGVARIVLARILVERVMETSDWVWRAFGWGVMLSAMSWGLFSALTLVYYQYQWAGMIILWMTAGLAANGLTSLAPDIFLARSYLGVML